MMATGPDSYKEAAEKRRNGLESIYFRFVGFYNEHTAEEDKITDRQRDEAISFLKKGDIDSFLKRFKNVRDRRKNNVATPLPDWMGAPEEAYKLDWTWLQQRDRLKGLTTDQWLERSKAMRESYVMLIRRHCQLDTASELEEAGELLDFLIEDDVDYYSKKFKKMADERCTADHVMQPYRCQGVTWGYGDAIEAQVSAAIEAQLEDTGHAAASRGDLPGGERPRSDTGEASAQQPREDGVFSSQNCEAQAAQQRYSVGRPDDDREGLSTPADEDEEGDEYDEDEEASQSSSVSTISSASSFSRTRKGRDPAMHTHDSETVEPSADRQATPDGARASPPERHELSDGENTMEPSDGGDTMDISDDVAEPGYGVYPTPSPEPRDCSGRGHQDASGQQCTPGSAPEPTEDAGTLPRGVDSASADPDRTDTCRGGMMHGLDHGRQKPADTGSRIDKAAPDARRAEPPPLPGQPDGPKYGAHRFAMRVRRPKPSEENCEHGSIRRKRGACDEPSTVASPEAPPKRQRLQREVLEPGHKDKAEEDGKHEKVAECIASYPNTLEQAVAYLCTPDPREESYYILQIGMIRDGTLGFEELPMSTQRILSPLLDQTPAVAPEVDPYSTDLECLKQWYALCGPWHEHCPPSFDLFEHGLRDIKRGSPEYGQKFNEVIENFRAVVRAEVKGLHDVERRVLWDAQAKRQMEILEAGVNQYRKETLQFADHSNAELEEAKTHIKQQEELLAKTRLAERQNAEDLQRSLHMVRLLATRLLEQGEARNQAAVRTIPDGAATADEWGGMAKALTDLRVVFVNNQVPPSTEQKQQICDFDENVKTLLELDGNLARRADAVHNENIAEKARLNDALALSRIACSKAEKELSDARTELCEVRRKLAATQEENGELEKSRLSAVDDHASSLERRENELSARLDFIASLSKVPQPSIWDIFSGLKQTELLSIPVIASFHSLLCGCGCGSWEHGEADASRCGEEFRWLYGQATLATQATLPKAGLLGRQGESIAVIVSHMGESNKTIQKLQKEGDEARAEVDHHKEVHAESLRAQQEALKSYDPLQQAIRETSGSTRKTPLTDTSGLKQEFELDLLALKKSREKALSASRAENQGLANQVTVLQKETSAAQSAHKAEAEQFKKRLEDSKENIAELAILCVGQLTERQSHAEGEACHEAWKEQITAIQLSIRTLSDDQAQCWEDKQRKLAEIIEEVCRLDKEIPQYPNLIAGREGAERARLDVIGWLLQPDERDMGSKLQEGRLWCQPMLGILGQEKSLSSLSPSVAEKTEQYKFYEPVFKLIAKLHEDAACAKNERASGRRKIESLESSLNASHAATAKAQSELSEVVKKVAALEAASEAQEAVHKQDAKVFRELQDCNSQTEVWLQAREVKRIQLLELLLQQKTPQPEAVLKALEEAKLKYPSVVACLHWALCPCDSMGPDATRCNDSYTKMRNQTQEPPSSPHSEADVRVYEACFSALGEFKDIATKNKNVAKKLQAEKVAGEGLRDELRGRSSDVERQLIECVSLYFQLHDAVCQHSDDAGGEQPGNVLADVQKKHKNALATAVSLVQSSQGLQIRAAGRIRELEAAQRQAVVAFCSVGRAFQSVKNNLRTSIDAHHEINIALKPATNNVAFKSINDVKKYRLDDLSAIEALQAERVSHHSCKQELETTRQNMESVLRRETLRQQNYARLLCVPLATLAKVSREGSTEQLHEAIEQKLEQWRAGTAQLADAQDDLARHMCPAATRSQLTNRPDTASEPASRQATALDAAHAICKALMAMLPALAEDLSFGAAEDTVDFGSQMAVPELIEALATALHRRRTELTIPCEEGLLTPDADIDSGASCDAVDLPCHAEVPMPVAPSPRTPASEIDSDHVEALPVAAARQALELQPTETEQLLSVARAELEDIVTSLESLCPPTSPACRPRYPAPDPSTPASEVARSARINSAIRSLRESFSEFSTLKTENRNLHTRLFDTCALEAARSKAAEQIASWQVLPPSLEDLSTKISSTLTRAGVFRPEVGAQFHGLLCGCDEVDEWSPNGRDLATPRSCRPLFLQFLEQSSLVCSKTTKWPVEGDSAHDALFVVLSRYLTLRRAEDSKSIMAVTAASETMIEDCLSLYEKSPEQDLVKLVLPPNVQWEDLSQLLMPPSSPLSPEGRLKRLLQRSMALQFNSDIQKEQSRLVILGNIIGMLHTAEGECVHWHEGEMQMALEDGGLSSSEMTRLLVSCILNQDAANRSISMRPAADIQRTGSRCCDMYEAVFETIVSAGNSDGSRQQSVEGGSNAADVLTRSWMRLRESMRTALVNSHESFTRVHSRGAHEPSGQLASRRDTPTSHVTTWDPNTAIKFEGHYMHEPCDSQLARPYLPSGDFDQASALAMCFYSYATNPIQAMFPSFPASEAPLSAPDVVPFFSINSNRLTLKQLKPVGNGYTIHFSTCDGKPVYLSLGHMLAIGSAEEAEQNAELLYNICVLAIRYPELSRDIGLKENLDPDVPNVYRIPRLVRFKTVRKGEAHARLQSCESDAKAVGKSRLFDAKPTMGLVCVLFRDGGDCWMKASEVRNMGKHAAKSLGDTDLKIFEKKNRYRKETVPSALQKRKNASAISKIVEAVAIDYSDSRVMLMQ